MMRWSVCLGGGHESPRAGIYRQVKAWMSLLSSTTSRRYLLVNNARAFKVYFYLCRNSVDHMTQQLLVNVLGIHW
jgi:hypothetical protein